MNNMPEKQNCRCPVCGGLNLTEFWQPDQTFADSVDQVEFFRSPFKPDDILLKCRTCQHVFLFPERTSNSEIGYNSGTDQGLFKYTLFRRYGYEKKGRLRLRKPVFKDKKRVLKTLIEPLSDSPRYPENLSYLDLGSGIGLLVWAARAAGMDAYGIDIDPLAVEYGKSNLGLNLAVCNFETDPFPWRRHFDIITMTHVLEHIIDPAAALRKLYQRLNPNGLLTIEVPNIYSRSAHTDFLKWEYNSGEVHLHFYSIQSLQQLLLKTGFAIEHTLTKCKWSDRWLSGDCLVVYARKTVYPDNERITDD